MLRFSFWLAGAVVMTAALWLTGCGSESSHDDGGGDHGTHDHGGNDHGKGGGSNVEANLAKLSAEDRALAEQQQTCPVSGEALGSMGVPIKLDVDGKAVFICCKACEKKAPEAHADDHSGKHDGQPHNQ